MVKPRQGSAPASPIVEQAKHPTPQHLQPYVEILGAEDAVEFLLAFGGAPIYLAARPQARSRVAEIVGVTKAKALAKRFGAGHVRVPTGKSWIARRLKDQGTSVYEIARRLHVTDTWVRKYLRDDDRQLTLF